MFKVTSSAGGINHRHNGPPNWFRELRSADPPIWGGSATGLSSVAEPTDRGVKTIRRGCQPHQRWPRKTRRMPTIWKAATFADGPLGGHVLMRLTVERLASLGFV